MIETLSERGDLDEDGASTPPPSSAQLPTSTPGANS
jgi:hypothetical protein